MQFSTLAGLERERVNTRTVVHKLHNNHSAYTPHFWFISLTGKLYGSGEMLLQRYCVSWQVVSTVEWCIKMNVSDILLIKRLFHLICLVTNDPLLDKVTSMK